MDKFDYWLKGCEQNGTEVWCLEGEGKTALYKLQRKVLVKNNYFNDVPTFHVWIKGEWLTATTDYQGALAVWNNHKGD